MKKFLRFPVMTMLLVALSVNMTSCDDDNNNETNPGMEPGKVSTIEKYVNDVVVATYKSLADESMKLYEACIKLKATPTQANIDAACQEWIDSRLYWELSEAFLYGPAKENYIDPHIDSWPLDKALLDLTLKNTSMLENMDKYGCDFAGFSTLGYGLLGFHAVEYVLFRDGGPRKLEGGTDKDGVVYNALSSQELAYCVAVAEDLRNQCILLEASWAGMDNISDEKQQIMEDTELEPTVNYGEVMIAAGESGNKIYKSQKSAYVQILMGMVDIVDEVGNTKIADPVSTKNVLDVESWYSWNSIDDFADNIRGVRNAYLGGTTGSAATYSISSHIKSLNPTLDSEIQAALTNAIQEITDMPAPFRDNLTTAAAQAAMNACNALLDKLEEAQELVEEN